MTNETIKHHISSGSYDAALKEIIKEAENRLAIVRAKRSSSEFGAGDTVVFNSSASPRYLCGNHGTIVGKRGDRVAVKLKNPVGNFARSSDGVWESTTIRVTPGCVDLI
jgi:hypothetical protein